MMKRLIAGFAGLGLTTLLIAGSSGNCQADKSKNILRAETLLSGSVTPLWACSDQPDEDSAGKKFGEDFIAKNNQDIKKVKRFCFNAKPKPKCGSFLITEFGYAFRFDHSSDNRQYLTWELGWMMNTNKRSAVGSTVLFGLDQDFEDTRLAFKPRLRRWLTETESLDLAAGILLPAGQNHSFISPSYTGHVGFNVGDCFALTGQVELIRREKTGTDVAWYGGFKLGTPTGAITGTVVAAVIGILTLCSSFSGGVM